MRKACPFFFCQNIGITLFINHLLQIVTVGYLVYSQPNFCDAVMCLVVTVLDLSFLSTKSKNIRIHVSNQSAVVSLLQTFIVLMSS